MRNNLFHRILRVVSGAVTGLVAASALAQEPKLTNAKLQSHAITGGLERTLHSLVEAEAGPAWIGYSVPAVAGNHHICCYSGEERRVPANVRHGRCLLEGRDDGLNFQNDDEHDHSGSARVVVVFRVADHRVGKLRVFSEDCELDVGGLPFNWLTGVEPKESVEWLAGLVKSGADERGPERRLRENAVTAIALHGDAAADRALAHFVEPSQPEQLRKDTAFWLGNVRGQAGYEVLRRLVHDDPSDNVRDQCVFALSISKVPEALATMIDVARHDRSRHIRGQALFWLSQKGGREAADAIGEAVNNDPDAEVRKKAIFALSQLKQDEGVPKLIEAAKSNSNREARKEALFWLSQKAGKKATEAIADAAENDPDVEIKKKAIFGLSQLPQDEGVPKLIQVAKTNRSREARKEAIFWLGQSHDDRALAFFEEVLTR